MDNERIDTNLGISRRTLLKRGAVVGGTLVWAAPAVQSFARPAFATHEGSPGCNPTLLTDDGQGNCVKTTYHEDQACCDCIAAQTSSGNAFGAAAHCESVGACRFDDTTKTGTTSC